MSHREIVIDQFTKQAVPFLSSPGIRDEQALRLLIDFTGARPDDTLLDVACGPGLVVCAFAPTIRHATGIDLTPAMIEEARALQQEKGLMNVTWQIGDVLALPYKDAAFSIVTSRFAFHQLTDPAAILSEMKRVCAPGGRIVLIDVAASPDPAKAAAFNRMEKLRDPSHVRALTLAEMETLFREAGLADLRSTSYRLHGELEGLLQRSFPDPGNDRLIRQMFAARLENDGLGLETRHQGEEIHYAYPIAILMSSTSAISKESKAMKNFEPVDPQPKLAQDGPVRQRRAPASPADAPPRRAAPLLAVVPILLVIVTFLFWYLTWFGRPLRDSEMDQYLTEASVPHKTQHALAQLAERMAHGDPAARRWYPLVLKLAENKESGLRAMSAWVMGQDNQSEAFHAELRRLLEDREPAVRSNAALALVRFHDAAGEPQLRLMLRPYAVAAPETGRVSYSVKEGVTVTTGSVVARIDTGDHAQSLEARSPLAGQVERRTRTEGATVTAGEEIAVLSPGEEQVWESLRALFLVGQAADLQDVERLALVAPGMSERVRQQAALTAQAIRRRTVARTSDGRPGEWRRDQ